MNTEQTPNQAFEDDVQKSQAFAVATSAITQDQLLLSEKVGAIKTTGFLKKLVPLQKLSLSQKSKKLSNIRD